MKRECDYGKDKVEVAKEMSRGDGERLKVIRCFILTTVKLINIWC